MNWCEHITENFGIKFKCGEVNKVLESEDFKFCPICGAKRPERKGLADKFFDWVDKIHLKQALRESI